jgi:uncharacterized protein YndB with AHSA1/START domain
VSERTAKPDTTVVERKFKSSSARVFAAWKDPDAYGRWNYPGDDWVMADYENDFPGWRAREENIWAQGRSKTDE